MNFTDYFIFSLISTCYFGLRALRGVFNLGRYISEDNNDYAALSFVDCMFFGGLLVTGIALLVNNVNP